MKAGTAEDRRRRKRELLRRFKDERRRAAAKDTAHRKDPIPPILLRNTTAAVQIQACFRGIQGRALCAVIAENEERLLQEQVKSEFEQSFSRWRSADGQKVPADFLAKHLPPWLISVSASIAIQRCYRGFRGRKIYWEVWTEEQNRVVQEVQKQLEEEDGF
jgi:hypothetical protein